MGRALLIAVVAVMFLPATASARPPDCGPATARTIERSAAVRVYFAERGATKNYYACWRRTHGKPVRLTYPGVEPPEFVNRFRLRGRYITFVQTSCSRLTGCDSFLVATYDVKSRQGVASTDYLDGRVLTLVATRGGAAAFLATTDGAQYIQKLDSLGVEEIDHGTNLRSLTLHGSRLHWLHGAQPRDDHIAHVRTCGPKSAYTEALSARIRVYLTDPFKDEEYRNYACLLGGGKPLFLGQDQPGNTTQLEHADFELVGNHVFWFEYDCGSSECLIRLHSADLIARTKRRTRGFTSFSRSPPTLFPNARGFAAELFRTSDSPPGYALYSFDSRGEQLLDQGPGVDPASVTVFADSVVWRHDGEQRSAPLQ